MIRKLLLCLMILLTALSPARPARAQFVGGKLTIDPAVPAPGKVNTLTLTLVDAAGNPLPATAVRAGVGAMDQPAPPLTPLKSLGQGRWQVQLPFPDALAGLIRMEADIAGETLLGQMMIRLGAEFFQVKDMDVILEVPTKGGAPTKAAGPEASSPPAPGEHAGHTNMPGMAAPAQPAPEKTNPRRFMWFVGGGVAAVLAVAALALRRPRRSP